MLAPGVSASTSPRARTANLDSLVVQSGCPVYLLSECTAANCGQQPLDLRRAENLRQALAPAPGIPDALHHGRGGPA